MRYRSRAFLAGILGFTVAFVVACGGGNGLLSANQASNLNGQLSSVSAAVAAGDCSAAAAAALQFSNQVGALPSGVNTTLIENLGQGAATISAARRPRLLQQLVEQLLLQQLIVDHDVDHDSNDHVDDHHADDHQHDHQSVGHWNESDRNGYYL